MMLASLVPLAAQEPPVITPTKALFVHEDVDYNKTSSYVLSFYRCASITAGVCVGQGAVADMIVKIPRQSILTHPIGTPDPGWREIDLTAPDIAALLARFPPSSSYVATITALAMPPRTATPFESASLPSPPFTLPPPPSPCRKAGPGALAATILSWTSPLKPGARGHVLFDLSTTRTADGQTIPIALIELRVGNPVIARLPAGTGGDLRNAAAIRFTAPITPGAYRFVVKLTDTAGCTYESGLIREITVQP